MQRHEIPFDRLTLPVFQSWDQEWFLLASGDFQAGRFNAMTVGWGSLGCMWKRPMAMVVVRPTRYTYELMEEFPDFTICHFPAQFRNALSFCGSKSGRKMDKIARSGLTPIPGSRVLSPAFAEADLIIECRKMYFDDFDPSHFLAGFIEENYPARDYHRLYLGEMKAVFGSDRFSGA